ncbi:MAG: shikimate kinase [Candidatus Polarisedimenticolia bacterium]
MARPAENIYLVGFMGSGKTSVGQHLARELGCRFVDLDAEIERRRGLSVAEIFETDGETGFRRLEAAALRETGSMRDVVIATGGGTLTRWENRDYIQRHGVMIWLDAPLDLMLERCRSGARRPLLGTSEAMAGLLAERLPGYRSAVFRIDAGHRSSQEIASDIAAWLASRRS